MSEEIPSLLSYREKPWTEWIDLVENHQNMLVSDVVEKNIHPSVCLLPRKDILLYGLCPKMDVRVLCNCDKCGKVMMPSAFASHSKEKHGPDQVQTAPVIPPGTSLLKKKYLHSKSKKKTILQPPVPPPPLFPKQTTPPPCPVTPAQAELSPPVLQPIHATKSVTPPPALPSLSSPTNNPRHKKSKKNYKVMREYNPDKHCGVVDGHKGPCLRSITCSNHMVHLRKAVLGRSKDFHQLIADHKAAKDKEMIKASQTPTSTKVETITTTTSQNTTYRSVAPTVVKIVPTTQQTASTTTITSAKADIQVISQPLHITVPSPTIISSSTSQGNLENPSSVVYMPMSPVAVVSPVQTYIVRKPVHDYRSLLKNNQHKIKDGEHPNPQAIKFLSAVLLKFGNVVQLHFEPPQENLEVKPVVARVRPEVKTKIKPVKTRVKREVNDRVKAELKSQTSMFRKPVHKSRSLKNNQHKNYNKDGKHPNSQTTKFLSDILPGFDNTVHLHFEPPQENLGVKPHKQVKARVRPEVKPRRKPEVKELVQPELKLQFVQLGGPILRVASSQPLSPPLATQPVVVTIPVQNNNTPMYTSHPKPLIMSTCSTRKIGGTFVLQNERLDRQRSEIQLAANTRRSMINTHHHKPNILKNSMRSGNIKISAIKRQATDKLTSDSKQIRLNDVNGFILHADVSETAEAPQSNNSVHDKVTFINMK